MAAYQYLQQLDAKVYDQIKAVIAHGWNVTARRFIDAKTKKFLSQNQVTGILDAGILSGKSKLDKLASDLSSSKIDLAKFTIEASQTVKSLHILNSVLAVGGRADQMTIGQKTALQKRVKQELLGGKDPSTGERYGIKYLIKDIQNGNVSEAQLKNRLSMFSDSAALTQKHIELETKKTNGNTEGFRMLGSSDNHCPECVSLASTGWVKLEDLVMPGSNCSCKSSCKCSIIYRL